MKVCPVCHARCFDDMETCFGCMHRFGDGDFEPIDDLDVAEPRMSDSMGAAGSAMGPAEEEKVPRGEGAVPSESRAGKAFDESLGALAGKAEGGEKAERVVATVQPARGMHGALVVRVEIPTSMLRTSAVDVSLEPARC